MFLFFLNQDWNCWVLWEFYLEQFEELSTCFPAWLQHFPCPLVMSEGCFFFPHSHTLVGCIVFLFQPSFWVGNGISYSAYNLYFPKDMMLGIFSFSSVQPHTVVSDSLWPHELLYARFICPSPSPEACLSSCSSSSWCHPTNSSALSFLMVQLSHPYMTTGKIIALTTL